jgi:hypothetical protein
MLRWMFGGLSGGAVGAAAWVAVGYFTNYEIGWIAWGIGLLAGLGVRMAAHPGEQDESAVRGVVAAAIAVTCILAAKYLVFHLVGNKQVQALVNADLPDETYVAMQADAIARQREEQGQPVNWPPGMSYEEASVQADYPPDIWQAAKAEWDQLTPEEKAERKRRHSEFAQQLVDALPLGSFIDTFSPIDLLWFGLAIFTAFRVAGSSGEE